jgi:hypothetical protein
MLMISCYQSYHCAVKFYVRKASHMHFVHGFICRSFVAYRFVDTRKQINTIAVAQFLHALLCLVLLKE